MPRSKVTMYLDCRLGSPFFGRTIRPRVMQNPHFAICIEKNSPAPWANVRSKAFACSTSSNVVVNQVCSRSNERASLKQSTKRVTNNDGLVCSNSLPQPLMYLKGWEKIVYRTRAHCTVWTRSNAWKCSKMQTNLCVFAKDGWRKNQYLFTEWRYLCTIVYMHNPQTLYYKKFKYCLHWTSNKLTLWILVKVVKKGWAFF